MPLYKSSPQETALLLLLLVAEKEKEGEQEKQLDRDEKSTKKEKGPITRFRVSELTLKKLCCRKRLHTDYLLEVQEWLLDAGWSLFFTGSSYALIRSESAEGWVRLGSKRIQSVLDQVANGTYELQKLEKLNADPKSPPDD